MISERGQFSVVVADKKDEDRLVTMSIKAPLSQWEKLVAAMGHTNEAQLAFEFFAVLQNAVNSQK